ncbi:MAG: ribonuclease domain-containing protein, partial [Campylobacter concisus]|nr:ribonuclease domain-containing protein [Campylobacter concisus]
KDLVNTSISSNVDASMDLRVLTKSGQKDIAKEITSVANSLDNLNRYIKDSLPRNKLSEEKANEIYKEISNNGLRETIVNIFKQQGLDNEQIENLMSDRDIISLIKSYNTISSKTLYSSTDNLVTFDKDGIPTINVTNTKEENFYDFVIKGAKAVDTISKAIGESNAVAGIFVIQVATQGLLKTAISVASNEVKDSFTKRIKEGLSEYIAKDLLDINNKGNDEQRKKDIKLASDLSASVSIDIFVGGAYSIVKGSKNVVKADEKLKESNVNSNAIAKSNADLKSNEHNLNNKNGSVQTDSEIGGLRNNDVTIPYIGKIKDAQLAKNINETIRDIIDNPIKSKTQMKKGNGISFYNKNLDLPTMANGKSILYKEYRVKPIVNDNNVHRIVVGSDGSYYYTNTHYGDTIRNNSSSGIPFYKAGKLPQGTIKQIFGDIQ